jgi:hypothetical protein
MTRVELANCRFQSNIVLDALHCDALTRRRIRARQCFAFSIQTANTEKKVRLPCMVIVRIRIRSVCCVPIGDQFDTAVPRPGDAIHEMASGARTRGRSRVEC